jgi:glucosamine-6-phosphate deaminase
VWTVEIVHLVLAKSKKTTMPTAAKTETVDSLKVQVYDTRQKMGAAAGQDVETKIQGLLAQKEVIRMVFAAAPSQNELLDYLAASQQIDWSRIEAFHMDEYVGLAPAAPQRFAHFLTEKLFKKVNLRRVFLIEGTGDPDETCRQYAHLLRQAPIDIVCLGIGENGHIAFNDPPVADFADPEVIKRVQLDEVCRQQQVNDGCFPGIEQVPQEALTLTIPTLLSGKHLFCVVPGKTKAQAVRQVLEGPVTTACPASVLRTHPACTLYLDRDAYGESSL